MKLYSLSLQAIGPFAGSHTIDLAALGQAGIFLLEGPTGAGKSTIIDAIVFALYGDLAGESASKERLHSHHAAPGVEPYVDLVFEVDSGIYRVRRTPAHQRPKRRGEGTTMQNEKVRLSRLHSIDAPDTGETISTSTQEAGHEIADLVGLRKDQFLQTVVLPQGEFAKFLRSNGEDRKELLETIFRTEIYEQMTRTLVEMRRDANARTEGARQHVQSATAVLASASDVEVEELLTADGHVDRERLTEIVDTVVGHATESAAVAAQAAAARQGAEQEFTAAEQLTAALSRRADLLERRDVLAAQRPQIDAAARELAAGQRAAVVVGAARAQRAAVAALEAAGTALADAETALGPDTNLTDAQCAELDDTLGRRITHLTSFIALEAGLPARFAEIDRLDERVADIEVQLIEIEKRLEDRPVRREALQTAKDHQLVLTAGLADARSALDRAARVVESALLASTMTERLSEANSTLRSLIEIAQTAVAEHADLRRRRIQGMAGELADALVEGEPCAVCGSPEHPKPAQRAEDHPDDESIENADLEAKTAEAEVALGRSVVDRLEAERVAAVRSAGGLSVEDAQRAHDDAATLVAQTELARERVTELDRDLNELDAAELADERERGQANATLSELKARFIVLSEAIAADQASIAQELGGQTGTLTELAEQVATHRLLVQRYASARRDYQLAADRLEETTDVLREQLTEHEFADVEDVMAAILPADRSADLERLVTTHRAQSAVVDDGLAAAELIGLTGTEEPGLDEARIAREEARTIDQAAAGAAATLQTQAAKVRARRDELAAALDDLDEVAADAAAVIRMADVADGSSRANLKNLTLGTYVLMRRFEDVVAAANARLGPMSDGRYQLRATDEKERGARGRRTGLALAVLDTETGQEREPRTLSGGETFYVSLCLALGLADVVTGEAGGIEIGTLFVDEGFGSLDPETLDDVMSELTALARGGRVIGIVSHVEDLKLRVADRIEVRRGADGSSTLSVKV
ncbi:AAA family ATPase [Aeromicrobium sp. P5_D10]